MNAPRLFPLVLSAAVLSACGGPLESEVEVDGELTAAEKIYYGDVADSAHHYATVSLHTQAGSRVLKSPFCSGTLIAEDVVLTAGHCVEAWGGGVLSASQVAACVGRSTPSTARRSTTRSPAADPAPATPAARPTTRSALPGRWSA